MVADRLSLLKIVIHGLSSNIFLSDSSVFFTTASAPGEPARTTEATSRIASCASKLALFSSYVANPHSWMTKPMFDSTCLDTRTIDDV